MSHRPTLLVTGGAGFIGGAVVRRLLGDGLAQVVNLDKLTYAGNLDSLASVWASPDHVFVQGDIGDRELLAELFATHQFDGVINLAAESHVDRSIDGPAPFLETNVLGTFRLLEASLAYWQQLPQDRAVAFRFLHVSTDEVFGSLGPVGKFTEQTPYSPNSPYSASKASSDHFVRAWGHTYGLPTIITNCSNNYGPYQFPEKLLPLMILRARQGQPLPVYGDGRNVRDWLYVDDHVDALWTAFVRGAPGETYNIGGNCERTNLEIVELVCQLIDERCPELAHRPCRNLVTFVKDRPGHDRRYAIDSAKIERELGWSPRKSFAAGLAETIEWYCTHQDWVDRVLSGSYRTERLGLATQRTG